jgi:hypothetical protein
MNEDDGGEIYYKNVKEKTIPLIKILWERVLVKDSLPSLKWKMEAKREL